MESRTLRTEMLVGSAAIERFCTAHVAVFGLGGVGSWAAEALARAGIGEMTIVDHDTVSETNINRQAVALVSTVGRLKTEVMVERILDINPKIKIRAIPEMYREENRELFFEAKYDYIIDAIDTVSSKLDLIETATSRGIPIISALGTGNKIRSEGFRFADIYETSGCPLARVLRNELRKRGVKALRVLFSPESPIVPLSLEEPSPGRRSVPGSVPWVPPVAGLMLAGEVCRTLAGL